MCRQIERRLDDASYSISFLYHIIRQGSCVRFITMRQRVTCYCSNSKHVTERESHHNSQ